MFKKGLLAAGVSYLVTNKKTYCSPQPPLSMILRGAYENKIRRYSPPQKIFDVFATIYYKGRLLMSVTDMLKAICFYNFSVSDQSHIQNFKPKNIVSFLGKDDKFEIYDYFILARFLAFQKQKVQAYYLKNNIAEMTEPQFEEFLLNEVCADYVDHIKQSIIIQSRHFKPSKQAFQKTVREVSKSMFKQKQRMTFKDVQQCRKKMVEELYQFQFLMFPIQDEKIDGVDFARSIVKYVEPSKTEKYMKRIKRMNELEQIKIDMKGYKAFHLYMWANINELQAILNQRGAISTAQLAQLINKFVNKGSVSPEQIEVAVKILDYDDSGFLQKKQVLGVLKNLQYYTSVKSGQKTLIQSLKQDYQRFVNKFNRIKQIIEE